MGLAALRRCRGGWGMSSTRRGASDVRTIHRRVWRFAGCELDEGHWRLALRVLQQIEAPNMKEIEGACCISDGRHLSPL